VSRVCPCRSVYVRVYVDNLRAPIRRCSNTQSMPICVSHHHIRCRSLRRLLLDDQYHSDNPIMKRQRPSNSQRHGILTTTTTTTSSNEKSYKKVKSASTIPSHTTPSEKSNRNWKQWKDQQIHDYNTHQFLDSSATVHAGLFGARRLPEIKSLWRHVVQNEFNLEHNSQPDHITTRKVGESGGGKLSSRHLRRRAGSHKRRRRHRFPRGVESSNTDVDDQSDILQASEQLQQPKEKDMSQVKQKSRRARRKPALLKQMHSSWWQPQQRKQNPEKGKGLNSIKTNHHNWIPTHLWHAKRFHVSSSPIFSWSVPLLHANRGSRASLRLATSKCTIQDASWEVAGCAITLRACRVNSSTSTGEHVIKVLQSMLEKVTDINLSDDSIISGQRSAEGLIHEIDSFPAGLVGPGTFMFKPMKHDATDSEVHFLSIFVHPAIRLKVMAILTTLVENHQSAAQLRISTKPYSLLRVRGTSSTATVADVLSVNWIDMLPRDMNVSEVDHGTLFKTNVQCDSSTQSPNQIVLKRHQPNNHHNHLQQNTACSGWDILCHPSICNDLFQLLVREGGSCAIGLLEDARAQLEAYPPLPIFPRDYPDSAEGRLYWEGSSKDWTVVRSCVEGSWGRNNKLIRRSQSGSGDGKTASDEPEISKLVTNSYVFARKNLRINWSCLVSPNSDQSVIVVRGSFGVPFLQLLHGCGRLLHSESTGQTRRPRRPVRPSNVAVHAPPLSKDEKERHSKFCQKLKTSLSLPALLRCEVVFENKGSPSVGDVIFIISHDGSCDDNSVQSSGKESPLGLVIAGGFSPTRGRSYGVALVSAAMFIDALDGTEHGMVKDEKMFLEVEVAKGLSSPRHLRRCAMLSLLF